MTSAERTLDPLLDDAPCGFIRFADDGVIELVNRTLATMLGYASEELIGRHVESILSVGSRIFYQTHFFPLLRLHGRADEIFLLLRPKEGADVGALANAVRREHDRRWSTDCVLMEVRERRKFEDALLRAKKAAEAAQATAEEQREEIEAANDMLERQALELEMSQQQLVEQATELEEQRRVADEANRAKSAFLAMMSHELRTPLNAIGGYVQLIEMGLHGPVTAAQTEALGRITKSQQHLMRLINDVLNLARIESGRVEYKLEALLVRDVVDVVLPMVEPQLAARRLHCEVHVEEGLTTYADREKVEQILLNLLSNAVKFTAPDGRISIDGVGDGGGGPIRIHVRDTGKGIAADQLASIFEPFVQVGTGKTHGEGTGLGLAISRDLARGMGGNLDAESEPGVGSTFTLTLPAHRP